MYFIKRFKRYKYNINKIKRRQKIPQVNSISCEKLSRPCLFDNFSQHWKKKNSSCYNFFQKIKDNFPLNIYCFAAAAAGSGGGGGILFCFLRQGHYIVHNI